VALAGERDAGIDDAQPGGDAIAMDEVAHDLRAELVAGLVVALDELDTTPEQAAGGVELGSGDADALAHRQAHRRRRAGEGAGHPHPDRRPLAAARACTRAHGLCRQLRQQEQKRHEGAPEQREEGFHSFTVGSVNKRTNWRKPHRALLRCRIQGGPVYSDQGYTG